jgi:hypothetical protein
VDKIVIRKVEKYLMSFKKYSLAVYICSHIFEETEAILLVSHEDNGDWQFLCGADHTGGNAHVTCIGHLIQRDKTLLELEDLPKGWMAERRSSKSSWVRYPIKD